MRWCPACLVRVRVEIVPVVSGARQAASCCKWYLSGHLPTPYLYGTSCLYLFYGGAHPGQEEWIGLINHHWHSSHLGSFSSLLLLLLSSSSSSSFFFFSSSLLQRDKHALLHHRFSTESHLLSQRDHRDNNSSAVSLPPHF